MELMPLFEQRRARFQSELEHQTDPKAAYDACVALLSDIARSALTSAQDSAERVRVNELMAAAKGGLGAMLAVNQVELSLRLSGPPSHPARRRRRGLREWLPVLPGALMALTALWLALNQRWGAAGLCAASAALSMLTLTRLRPARQTVPDVYGQARVDSAELARRVERIVHDIDALLLNGPALERQSPLLLNAPLMESIQMLMEAKLTEDGAFALRTLPQMMAALNGQGIEIVMYAQEQQAYFDLLPAPEGGETIRPALLKDGQLLMRGQATIEG